MVEFAVWTWNGFAASCTVTLKLSVDACGFAIDNIPLAESVTPAAGTGGPNPYPGMPPLALSCAVYAMPMLPAGNTVSAIAITLPTRIVGAYGIDSGGVAASVAVIVTVVPPGTAAVGVPLIVPVLGLIANPGGRPVAVHVYGVVPPLTASGVVV